MKKVFFFLAAILAVQSYGQVKVPPTPLVDKTTYDADVQHKDFKILKTEVKDYYYVTTYFVAKNVKQYAELIDPDTPYHFQTVTLVKDDDEYKKDTFKDVVKAEIKDNYYVITYFDWKGNLKTYYNPLERKTYISTTNLKFGTVSILTVPFKIRPATGDRPSYSRADIDNLGLYVSALSFEFERWYNDDTTSTFKISAGGYLAPSVEELSPENSSLTAKSNQAYLTTALAITLGWDKLNFVIVPIGVDTGFSDTSKTWVYNGNIWWGFGVGIDTSLFQF